VYNEFKMAQKEKLQKKAATLKKPQPEENEPLVKQEKILFTWAAPSRPFKRRNKDFYATVIAIAAIVGLIVFLIDGWLPVILIISLVFLFYVMSSVEPEAVKHGITTWGVRVGGDLVDWFNLGRFWFSRRFDNDLLIIEANAIGGRIELVINPKEKTKIEKVLSRYLIHEEIPPSSLDKASNWFSKKLPQ